MEGPLAFSIPYVAQRFGVSPTHIRNLIGKGEIKTIRLGSRVLISQREIDRILRGEQSQELELVAH